MEGKDQVRSAGAVATGALWVRRPGFKASGTADQGEVSATGLKSRGILLRNARPGKKPSREVVDADEGHRATAGGWGVVTSEGGGMEPAQCSWAGAGFEEEGPPL